RHVVSVATMTPSDRDTVSKSSPRSSRITAAVLRWRDIRPPRAGAAAPDSCGRSAAPARSVVPSLIDHPSRGYRPLTGCLTQLWSGGVGDHGPAAPLTIRSFI